MSLRALPYLTDVPCSYYTRTRMHSDDSLPKTLEIVVEIGVRLLVYEISTIVVAN